jgi:hypothetical protein
MRGQEPSQTPVRLHLLGEYDFSEDKLTDSFGIFPPKSTV